MRSRELGFTLERFAISWRLSMEALQTCGEMQVLANTHLTSVRTKIADLKRIEHVLSSTVRNAPATTYPSVPVIDALTEVA